VCGTIYIHNLHAGLTIVVNDVGDVAVALAPLAGKFAALLFALDCSTRRYHRVDLAVVDGLLRL